MNCKKCGNKMADGARFCISCGAEHDANGELVVKNSPVDYNKTVMVNDLFANNNKKIDYNKTMMASDIPQNGFNNINNSYNNLDANKNVNVKKKIKKKLKIKIKLLK